MLYVGQSGYWMLICRSLPHRKLLENTSGGKLAPVAISPDETPDTVPSDCTQNSTIRRPSVTTLVSLPVCLFEDCFVLFLHFDD